MANPIVQGVRQGLHLFPQIRQGIGHISRNFPTTVSEMEGLIGHTPNNIWTFQELSGDVLDKAPAGNDLTPVSTPTQGIDTVFTRPGANTTNASTDSFDASANTILDIDLTTSIAFIIVVKLGSVAGTRSVFGKRQSTGDLNGYELTYLSNGNLRWTLDSGAVVLNATVAEDHSDGEWRAVLVYLDRNVDSAAIFTDLGTADGTSASLLTPTSTLTFAIGGSRSVAAECDYAYCASFLGANAEGMGQATLDAFWGPQ